MNSIQESLFKTMKEFTEYSDSHSTATRTIECPIVKCINDDTGEYLVLYGGNNITAFDLNGRKYKEGELVYVLIPENSMLDNVVILGSPTGSARTLTTNEDGELMFKDTKVVVKKIVINGKTIKFLGLV